MSGTGAALDRALAAAGALALVLEIDAGRLRLDGEATPLGLGALLADPSLSRLRLQLAPGDRARFDQVATPGPLDLRLRLIGDDHEVRYVRLIGAGDGAVWRGLLVPAGGISADGLEGVGREAALLAGLQAGEVCAHHQPVVDLQTGALAGFEALARWVRPGVGLLGAEEFVPLAAERGHLMAVGDCVRRSAALDLSAWRAARPQAERLWVASNATASELCAPGFAEGLVAMVDAASLPHGAFKLEISETEVMADPEAAEAALNQVRAGGIPLVLDDFGTGYSSLARLDRFPFDVVKIDQYFVRAALADPSARQIISSVVRIADSYGMLVVAEGIETGEAAAMVADLGCHYGQGFRFASALPPEQAAQAVSHGLGDRFLPAQ